jgi:hypothetical protein
MPELVVPTVFVLYLSTTYVYDELLLPLDFPEAEGVKLL